MLNRRRGDEQRAVNGLVERAVQLARLPGSVGYGGPASSSLGTASTSSAMGGGTTFDTSGNTIHSFMLDEDQMDDAGVRL